MFSVRFRTLLLRLFLLSLLVGAGATAVTADDWKCPNCKRCDHGCQTGSDVYGFDNCALNDDGSCNPNGGNPCCEPREE